jgi:uncharacterized protein
MLVSHKLKEILRYIWITASLYLVAHGIVLVVQARLGAAPWDVLHLGISLQTGISMGRVMQSIGLILLLISWIFHVKPSLVTLINMVFLGQFVDIIRNMNYLPSPEALWMRIFIYLIGVAVFGIGVGFYIGANRGAGPRDSLMMALTRATSLRVGVIRTIMEVVVATTGYFLGGPLGVGTVMFALFIGFFVELGFSMIKAVRQSRLLQSVFISQQVAVDK